MNNPTHKSTRKPINELLIDSWQCQLDIDKSINLTNEVSIDSWQRQLNFDESLNAERQVSTWQSLPEISPENGDFTSEQTKIPNIELGTSTAEAPVSSLRGSEGVLDVSRTDHKSMSQIVLFQDQNASWNDNPQSNEWAMPEPVDIHKSGLQHLLPLAALQHKPLLGAALENFR